MRPADLSEYVGHGEHVGPGTPLRNLLDRNTVTSLLLWGPPGSGKTSLARVVASHVEAAWTELSAVTSGVKDVRRVIEEASARMQVHGRPTVLFIDEIHRFNKSQQDGLLPAVESGAITLIGATTENPFFEVNSPLLSRCRLLQLQPLTPEDLAVIVTRAVAHDDGLAGAVTLTEEALESLVMIGDGDARTALNALENATAALAEGVTEITADHVAEAHRRYRYDKTSDGHYDQVSAFIKSMRGSDPDAAVYWLLRMIESGEDPRFLARRMVILASEDIGLAAPNALPAALAAFDALDKVGLPEARFALVQCAIQLSVAPKSNSVTTAIGRGLEAVRQHGNAPVPLPLRDGHYKGAKSLGHGVGYVYPHDRADGFADQQYLPDGVATHERIYQPKDAGQEQRAGERLRALWPKRWR